MTYDPPAVLAHFSRRKGITIPLLSDPGSKTIRDFGILNESIPKDSFAYGVPHPGTYVIDERGIVTAKYFEPDYRDRVTAGSILLRQFTSPAGARVFERKTPRWTLRTFASNDWVFAGSRITLALEIELGPKMHLYAPGAQGYIPIQWTAGEAKGWVNFEPSYPPSETLHLRAIGEKAPVYRRKVRITRDIKAGQTRELRAMAGSGNRLVIEDSLRLQACDDKKCYLPENVPLRWELTVSPADSTRVPAGVK